MATRRNTDDPEARNRVTDLVTDRIGAPDAPFVVDLFETAEFETATSRVGGNEITLRRIVLTGPWEVVTK